MTRFTRHAIWVVVAAMLLALVGASTPAIASAGRAILSPRLVENSHSTGLVTPAGEDHFSQHQASPLTVTPVQSSTSTSSIPQCKRLRSNAAQSDKAACTQHRTLTNTGRGLATPGEVASLKKQGVHPNSNLPVYYSDYSYSMCNWQLITGCIQIKVTLRWRMFYQYNFIAFENLYGYTGAYVDNSEYHSIVYSVSAGSVDWHNYNPAYYYYGEDLVPWGDWHIGVIINGSPATNTWTMWGDCYASGNCYMYERA